MYIPTRRPLLRVRVPAALGKQPQHLLMRIAPGGGSVWPLALRDGKEDGHVVAEVVHGDVAGDYLGTLISFMSSPVVLPTATHCELTALRAITEETHLRHQHPKREHVARHRLRYITLTLPVPLMITGQRKQLGRHIPSRAHAIEIGRVS